VDFRRRFYDCCAGGGCAAPIVAHSQKQASRFQRRCGVVDAEDRRERQAIVNRPFKRGFDSMLESHDETSTEIGGSVGIQERKAVEFSAVSR